LVMKYGKFLNILKNVLKWKPRKIIDIESHWDEENYDLLRNQFSNDILIVIDPVDKRRNAAAAISAKNFYKFKKIAREFLQIEKKSLFYETGVKPLDERDFAEKVEDRGTEVFFIKFKKPDVVDDILYPQLRKFINRLESVLRDYEFNVLRSDYWTDEKNTGVLMEFEVSKLSVVNKRIGPEVFDLENSLNFLQKYRKIAVNGPTIEGNNWIVEINRQWKTAEDKLKEFLKDNKKSLEAKGIPNYIAKEISSKFELMDIKKIRKFMEKNKDFSIFLRKYLEMEKLV